MIDISEWGIAAAAIAIRRRAVEHVVIGAVAREGNAGLTADELKN